jgi:hypothetical protein
MEEAHSDVEHDDSAVLHRGKNVGKSNGGIQHTHGILPAPVQRSMRWNEKSTTQKKWDGADPWTG